MRAGDLHWVDPPLAGGHEQQGRRPAIVIQNDNLFIHPTPENGLRQGSVALVFQLRAIDRRRLQERIGIVGAETLNAIFEEPGKLTGRVVQKC